MIRTVLGIDRALRDGLVLPGRGRAGVLCNATTVTAEWVPTAEALARVPGLHLERIFSPQHGFAAEKQDNMIESADGVHPRLGVPIVSLYGARREPAPAALDGLDALVIDVPDVGTRVYTFLVTALLVLRECIARGLPVIVLDRPNPIGGAIEGPVLDPAFGSFVGLADVPLRHGLTAAEFCAYGAAPLGLAADNDGLRVIAMENWRRDAYYDDTGLPWTMPSPNLPTLETAIVYPGQVMLEGTNISEGRGTTRPFEVFGAPFVDPPRLEAALRDDADLLAGARLREVAFEPTFQKHAGQLSRGFQIHVTDRARFRPIAATIAILCALRRVHGDAFTWREPPYEYETERMPIDLICGTDRVRLAIDAGRSAREIVGAWDGELAAFRERARGWLRYGDGGAADRA
jgi:uncharacterized protein YbbC (DUF1343 family)